jgi:hypothetical protein
MERLEAQFQAHAATTASTPAAAPAPPPAVTVTTNAVAQDLSPVRARPAYERLVRIACGRMVRAPVRSANTMKFFR